MTCEKQTSPEVIVLHLSPEDCPCCRPGPHTRPKDPRMLRLWRQLESKLLAHGGERAWRQHCWGLHNNTILETTVQQERYFGVALDEINALEFFKDTFLVRACRDWVKREYPHVVALEDRLYGAKREAEAEAERQHSESTARRKKVKSTH